MGKSTISMAIFNSYVKLPEGTTYHNQYGFVWNRIPPMVYHHCPHFAIWGYTILPNNHQSQSIINLPMKYLHYIIYPSYSSGIESYYPTPLYTTWTKQSQTQLPAATNVGPEDCIATRPWRLRRGVKIVRKSSATSAVGTSTTWNSSHLWNPRGSMYGIFTHIAMGNGWTWSVFRWFTMIYLSNRGW